MPLIPIEDIKIPVFAWVGEEDELAAPSASEIIRQKVKTLKHYRVMPGFDHGHMNWILEDDLDYYAEILEKMRSIVPSTSFNINMTNPPPLPPVPEANNGKGQTTFENELSLLHTAVDSKRLNTDRVMVPI